MEVINQRYEAECARPSDINEHLPTLKKYAAGCSSVAEFGVRGIVSTWALLKGLAEGNSESSGPLPSNSSSKKKRLLCLDIDPIPEIREVAELADEVGVELTFAQDDSAQVQLKEDYDLLFIDTWHVYGHLRRELAAHHSRVRKWIAMHDTEVDAIAGESIRMGMDVQGQAQQSGYPEEEITKGLRPALDEFLEAHKGEWEVAEHFENCNGLTVLRRVGATD